ncbi:MAG TPA: S26 family signal peptidase [Candidatus Limnocylindria bacterium]|nr:S26 family signal peptidase [Candidatus Limnocylindria bacterium]
MRPGGLIGPLLFLGGLVAARRWLDTVEVRGRSMAPTLLSGDRLLVARLGPRVGDVVLAADPRDAGRELVKRVVSIDAFGVTLRGDNPAASTDARTFGAIPTDRVRWRVLLRYWPLERAGPVPPAPPVVDEGGEDACAFPPALIVGDEPV